MAYWLTTHWPKRVDKSEDEPQSGVWVTDGNKQVISRVQTGDLVFIYESRNGKTVLRQTADGKQKKVPCRKGQEGIVALVEVTDIAYQPETSKAEKYVGGEIKWWRWNAPTRALNTDGFVKREDVAEILGYKSNWSFRGFGESHSGLARITENQFNALLSAFKSKAAEHDKKVIKGSQGGHKHGAGGGEGQEHLALKERVAKDPSGTLKEQGLEFVKMEEPFATGDKPDVVLQDCFGRFVAVEVEVDCYENEQAGPLQCMKYRALLAYECDRREEEIRSFLVAHSIHPKVQKKCHKFKIETKIVPREK